VDGSAPAAGWRGAVLRGTLAGFLLVPPLVVWWGTEGTVPFTHYREPKLAALGLLGWGFVLLFLALGPRISAADLRATLRKPFYALFLAFLLWAAMGRAWVRVPVNHLYEWGQYLLLFVVAVLLDAWSARDGRVVPPSRLPALLRDPARRGAGAGGPVRGVLPTPPPRGEVRDRIGFSRVPRPPRRPDPRRPRPPPRRPPRRRRRGARRAKLSVGGAQDQSIDSGIGILDR
jgi:hypothetical protein